MLKPDFQNERQLHVRRPVAPAGWQLLARSGEAALLADELGVIHAANPAAHRVLGQSEGRLIGGNWLNLLHPDDAESVAETLKNLRRKPGAHGICEARWQDGHGDHRWVEIALTNLQGDGTGWLLQLRHASSHREAALRLQTVETQFAQTQELASLAWWQWDVASGTMTWSDEMFQTLGLRPGECRVNRDLLIECVHPGDRDAVLRAFERCLRERRIFDHTVRIVRPSGSVRTLHLRARVLDDGRRVEGIAQDVTIKAPTGQDEGQRDARFRCLANANIVGIVAWDALGQITETNDAFLAITGYSRADLWEGHVRWDELTPPAFRAADSRALQELAERGVCTPYEKEFVRKDGSRVPILVAAAHLEPGAGRDLGLCFVLDISDQHRHVAAFQETLLRHHHLLAAVTGSAFTDPVGQPLRAVLLSEKVACALQHAAHDAQVRVADTPCEQTVLSRPELVETTLDVALGMAFSACQPGSALRLDCQCHGAAAPGLVHSQRLRLHLRGVGSAPEGEAILQRLMAHSDGLAGVEQATGEFLIWLDFASSPLPLGGAWGG